MIGDREEADGVGSVRRCRECGNNEERAVHVKGSKEGITEVGKTLENEDVTEIVRRVEGKREYETERDEVNPKRSKRESVDVEEEGSYDIDAQYGEYLYERWMWGSM